MACASCDRKLDTKRERLLEDAASSSSWSNSGRNKGESLEGNQPQQGGGSSNGLQCSIAVRRRTAMARAAGLAAGVALGTVNAPAYAAETKNVKMGNDAGGLKFEPEKISICKGDSVKW